MLIKVTIGYWVDPTQVIEVCVIEGTISALMDQMILPVLVRTKDNCYFVSPEPWAIASPRRLLYLTEADEQFTILAVEQVLAIEFLD